MNHYRSDQCTCVCTLQATSCAARALAIGRRANTGRQVSSGRVPFSPLDRRLPGFADGPKIQRGQASAS